MRMRTHFAPVIAVMMACLAAGPAAAAPGDVWLKSAPFVSIDRSPLDPWAIEFGAVVRPEVPAPRLLVFDVPQEQPARRAVPVEYSDFYKTRAKIHKYTSIATLPLFVANYFVGQDLYNHPGDESKKGLHGGLVAATAVVFGVNTVTGVWNLWEGRKDPNHRTKRMTHGILMIIADVGFMATAALAPSENEAEHGGVPTTSSGASTHRTVALTSMGIATVSYLIMLFGGK
jgi:hypothetical protein